VRSFTHPLLSLLSLSLVWCLCGCAEQGWVGLWLLSNILLLVAIVGIALDRENLKKRRWKQS
jgi:hypothetical protein